MLLIPAIDIKDGRCVRLVQGDFQAVTVYSDDPASQAARWVDVGARRIHIVDLDGAATGAPVNANIVRRIAAQFPEVEIQIGGGIRSLETAKRYLDAGVNYVIIGTRAVREPDFVAKLSSQFPGTVIAGIDVRGNAVATEGWADSGGTDATSLAKQLAANGAVAIVYTDIERDGMLSGVNVKATAQLAMDVQIPVIASGGIRDIEDIRRLLEVSHTGILGAIAGKSLYEGTLDFTETMRLIDAAHRQTTTIGD